MSSASADYSSLRSRLPNFFILGATKAGTTSLYRYLRTHPKIYLGPVKEPQFFCNENLFKKGLRFYSETFFPHSAGFPLRGDATPHYIYYEKVAKRIRETLPASQIKFIVIMRDPVHRAYSLYLNMVHEGVETLSFSAALEAEAERLTDQSLSDECSVSCQYVDSGMYAKQIRRYLNYFSRDQFLFLFLDDLKSRPHEVMEKVCDFLNVETHFRENALDVSNAAGTTRSRALQRFLRQPNVWRRRLGKYLPFQVKYKIVTTLLRWNKKQLSYPPMSTDLEIRLRRIFEADVKDLQALVEVDLSHWLPQ